MTYGIQLATKSSTLLLQFAVHYLNSSCI